MRVHFFTLILLSLAAAGCDDRAARNRASPDKDGMVHVGSGDKQMNAAIAEARAGMPAFLAALQQKGANRSHFSVKARYEFSSGAEHVWIGDVSFDGKEFTGRVENVPQQVKGMKYGDTVTVPQAAVSDWLYVEDSRLKGAFTLRVIYQRMPPAQQQAFRQQFPHKIDW